MTPAAALLLAALAASPAASAAPGAPIRRFGLFVGSNDGGAGRVALRYAVSDAEGLAAVLGRMGGVAGEDAALLTGPTRAHLAEGLARIRERAARARAAGSRTEFVFYYSGHADESGLLLGREKLTYGELRDAVDALPADVRVAIIDSCHAGSLVRQKGGKRVAPFLVDASSAVKGYAFLTSSSADEVAQESDRIRSSYFTFALLTGLRGAADASGDGKVTLTEAYQFAFQETLAKTEQSAAGPQHPAYDIHLAGTGDLVMTDLRAQTAGLVLAEDLAGRLYVRDVDGRLVVELRHPAGKPLELGLEPGRYAVRLDTGAGMLEAQAVLAEGKRLVLSRGDFGAAPPGEPVARRGGEGLRHVPVQFSVWHPVSLAGDGTPVSAGLSINLFYGRIAELRGLELGAGVNWETQRMAGVQLGLVNVVEGEVRGVQYGLASWAGGDATGYQAGLYGHVGGSFVGVQEGLVGIVRGEALGAQLNLYSQAASLRGVQAGLVNVAGPTLGGQGGLVNVAGSVTGVQAGLANWSSGAAGMQLGLANVAGSAWMPVGLVNVADHAEAPIGLFNWVKDGYRTVGAWASDVTPLQLGAKLGGTWTYAVLAVGSRPSSRTDRWFATTGLGVHVPFERWALDVDLLSGQTLTDGARDRRIWHLQLRPQAIIGLGRGLGLQLAPTWNMVVGQDGQDADLALLPQTVTRNGNTTRRHFPGFAVGLQWQLQGS
ncbi:MAG: caspase family protein [Deltaproteobacteria bacterium]|nr:caspase family protein [Deltaproteobacteria bacterium]